MEKSSQQPPLVLIADADKDNLYLLTTVVQDLGFRGLATDSGNTALEAYKRYRPNLILLETRFPDMSGDAVLTTMGKHSASSHKVPAIAVTSAALPGDHARCLRMGFDDYIAKPYSITTLENLICTHLGCKKRGFKSTNLLFQ